MAKRRKKSKDEIIQRAVADISKALLMEDPHIQIRIDGGFVDTPESKEFVAAIRTFTEAYKKFLHLDKISLKVLL